LEHFIQQTSVCTNDTLEASESHGFIYISFGSAVGGKLPTRIEAIFINVIRSWPKLRFLWKWTGETPQTIPHNLFVSDWFPQQDLLGNIC
jgi:UDP:flavonoid glycosyltransferase YjiC (YdhE family)